MKKFILNFITRYLSSVYKFDIMYLNDGEKSVALRHLSQPEVRKLFLAYRNAHVVQLQNVTNVNDLERVKGALLFTSKVLLEIDRELENQKKKDEEK